MEITKFVVSGRDKALLYGDYMTYRAQLSNRIHNLRKKLAIATKPRAKYTSKVPITAEEIGSNHEFAHLLLLTAERAWSNAMTMKSIHSTETKGITGSTRSHIISRLHKATVYADNLLLLLTDQLHTGATNIDVLEARAYAASLTGAVEFEKQGWEACVKSYSEARILYSALATAAKSDTFKDLLSGMIDPSIRYGAYQMRMPRTVAIPAIARKFFPRSDPQLVAQVEKLDPDILQEQTAKAKAESPELGAVPRTITWRSRQVDLEDAAIATALASVQSAASQLSMALSSDLAVQLKDKATAYDDVLIASQDAVDATKHAIDELVGEGVGQGDKRMQSLQITRTAVSYEMISWRIGRNRVLIGQRDGAMVENTVLDPQKWKDGKFALAKEEGTGRRLAQFREKAVLYDAILQSLDSIKELPGIAADSAFLEELEAKYSYFQALKCLAIARSHALISNTKNALALLCRAGEKCNTAYLYLASSMDSSDSSPPNIHVSSTQVQFLKDLLQGEVQRYRALVELSNLTEEVGKSGDVEGKQLLVENLNFYPTGGANLEKLISYPPKLEPVPVKPLFLDAAFNYIEYPGREIEKAAQNGVKGEVRTVSETGQTGQQKKGWFGFGR